LALRCSIRIWSHGSPPPAFVRTDNWGRAITAVPRADSLVRLHAHSQGCSRFIVTGFRVCLHALSSFQRTDISKRPRRFAHARVSLRPFGRRRRTQLPTASGELSEFTIAALACQLLFASISNFLFEARRSRPNRLGREAL